ncbi:MAG: hypothetical protein JJU02_01890 [Cryomorphaceae bacterium]|nr:hypothetical protein [Cryomorphaceae bacterium]
MSIIVRIIVLSGLFAGIFSSCTLSEGTIHSQEINLKPFNRGEYVVMDRAKGEAVSKRFWLLFIPIGGLTDETLNARAYNDAMQKAIDVDADGLLQPRFTYVRKVYPFLIFTYTKKVAVVDGRAFRIKTESEYQQFLKEESERFRLMHSVSEIPVFNNVTEREAQEQIQEPDPAATGDIEFFIDKKD